MRKWLLLLVAACFLAATLLVAVDASASSHQAQPCAPKQPCAMQPCAPKQPCAANPCAAKNPCAPQQPAAPKNPCAPR